VEKKELRLFLKRTIDGFKRADIFALKEAANSAIEEASLASDRQLAKLALVGYCLYKMSSKQHIVRHGRWADIKHDILFDLKKALDSVEKGDMAGFGKNLDAVIESIRVTDKNLGHYAQSLLEKAKVKYASTAYSRGLGLGQAAALTSADKRQVLRYIGVTKIADRDAVKMGISQRLKGLKNNLK
jgi:glycerate kinase